MGGRQLVQHAELQTLSAQSRSLPLDLVEQKSASQHALSQFWAKTARQEKRKRTSVTNNTGRTGGVRKTTAPSQSFSRSDNIGFPHRHCILKWKEVLCWDKWELSSSSNNENIFPTQAAFICALYKGLSHLLGCHRWIHLHPRMDLNKSLPGGMLICLNKMVLLE